MSLPPPEPSADTRALSDLEQQIRRRSGLDLRRLSLPGLERQASARCRALGLGSLAAYAAHVAGHGEEIHHLIEGIVVPETWFFREPDSFPALVHLLRPVCARANAKRPVHLLSLPCSTGEEAYSAAISFIRSGIKPDALRVDGVDISARAVETASRAVYDAHSFRTGLPSPGDRFFERTQEGRFSISSEVRSCVSLLQGSLFGRELSGGPPRYDAILCRNLFIYFDGDTRREALDRLHGLLRPGGVLLLASAETHWARDPRFESVNVHGTFLLQKRQPAGDIHAVGSPAMQPGTHAAAAGTAPSPLPGRRVGPAVAGSESVAPPRPDIGSARRLADAGQLGAAAAACEQLLLDRRPDSELMHLLGLIREAQGHEGEAMECYRRALYLDPDHYETLIHLALLRERVGDVHHGQQLRGRASRARSKSNPRLDA